MGIRQSLLENFAGDIEFHPRRGLLYVCLSIGAACYWIYSPSDEKFTTVPLVFALGSLPLFLKGILFFRRSSEGLGLSDQDLSDLAASAKQKQLPPIPSQAGQIVQDFGTGPLLLWYLTNFGKDINTTWEDPPRGAIFLTGATLFILGMAIRSLTASRITES